MPENKQFDLAKAIAFLLLFVSIFVISLTVLLIPSIRDYKKQNDIFKIEYSTYLKAKERFDGETERLKALKETNQKIIVALNKKTDEASITMLAKNYFKKTDVTKVGKIDKEGNFFYEDFNVTANFKSPKDLFSFLKALSEENAVAKVKSPLVMANSSDSVLSNFGIRVYYLNPPATPKK
jgi:hypothetical protein